MGFKGIKIIYVCFRDVYFSTCYPLACFSKDQQTTNDIPAEIRFDISCKLSTSRYSNGLVIVFSFGICMLSTGLRYLFSNITNL